MPNSQFYVFVDRSVREELQHTALEKHENLLSQGHNITNITIPYIDRGTNLAIYTSVVISVFVFGFIRAILSFRMMTRAARGLHNLMFNSIIRCPILFFDTNQSG